MRVAEVSWDEVVRAGTVLFGPSFGAAPADRAWRDELPRVYRRRALETHPDRAAVLGRSEAELLREFRAVSEAYELLVQLRAGPLPAPRGGAPGGARAPRPSAGAAPWPRPRRSGWTARAAPGPGRSPGAPRTAPAAGRPPPAAAPGRAAGAGSAARAGRAGQVRAESPLPRRRLRIAEFLYYSGAVTWQDLVGAIAWQRAQRPAVGRIAVDFGFLDPGEVAEILERRRIDGAHLEPFGRYAVRHGYLTPFQLLVLLGRQLRLQRPIGGYFVDRGLATGPELDEARARLFRHNLRHDR